MPACVSEIRERMADSLITRTPQAIALGAFQVINVTQEVRHPSDQILSLALVLKYLCEACGFTPGELFHIVDQMERDCRFRDVNTLDAVKTYITNEIRQKFP